MRVSHRNHEIDGNGFFPDDDVGRLGRARRVQFDDLLVGGDTRHLTGRIRRMMPEPRHLRHVLIRESDRDCRSCCRRCPSRVVLYRHDADSGPNPVGDLGRVADVGGAVGAVEEVFLESVALVRVESSWFMYLSLLPVSQLGSDGFSESVSPGRIGTTVWPQALRNFSLARCSNTRR
jgi:hypothetical protein